MKQMLPDHYFRVVQTEEDYKRLLASGMAWEWFVELPQSYAEHLQLKKRWLKHKEYDGT